MDEFFNEGFGGIEFMAEVLGFGHEEGVEAVDGFEFEVEVLWLLYGGFEVDGDDGFEVFEFSEKLEYAFVADFANGNFDAAEVEDHFAE